ncbi:MAG: hypothetical protein NZM11_00775 [Anaerolineales bacterium]|nr:hypothetical protein [Anaerolineales bacterium]
MDTWILTYFGIVLIVIGLFCLLALWIVVLDGERSVEPPPLPRYGEDDHD